MKLWGGRFSKKTAEMADDFNASISFDSRLYRQDIQGSIAHARMLALQGIILPVEAEEIVRGLLSIQEDIEAGKLEFSVTAEDVHMNIETFLIQRIGETGKKLHTARSRNDQVALDIRLYLRSEAEIISGLLIELMTALRDLAHEHVDTVMPGYTHLQKAQPISLAHHLLAYFEMLRRDWERLKDAVKRMDYMPLGSGALAGSGFPIDREVVRQELGFEHLTRNSLDAVSDRDFVLEFMSFGAILMVHLSRLSEEIILWATDEFGFIELDDAFSTGSSIMPQKKNPDMAELVRGKTGRVYGNLMSLLTTMKGLPLAYNKDMQEDKEPLFDSVDTLKKCLAIYTPMLRSARFNVDRMYRGAARGFTNATDLADYLVTKGMAFRDSHSVVGQIVAWCLEREKSLEEMTLAEFRGFSPLIDQDIYGEIKLKACVEKRSLYGGTAPEAIKQALEEADHFLQKAAAIIAG
ncbi:MAG: argininosuccinate lyase [Syntrophomonadaceae bacterium]|nr:argininosuccinate lyase [Syntrophomonadaceae bacterium]